MIALAAGLTAIAAATNLGGASSPARAESLAGSFPIVELRQYTLHDGKRDTLIDLFERVFIEPQEALGMKVIGTFRDLDRPNRFVWLRGFTDMDARLAGLSAFYSGPVWLAHREAANATMVDSDNVLLLHAPAAPDAFTAQAARATLGENRPAGLIVASIEYLKGPAADAVPAFEAKVKPALERRGIHPLGWFVTETAANNYPRLPVRQGEQVLVWFARFASDADRQQHQRDIDSAGEPLAPLRAKAPELLRLAPTQRSELR